MAKPEKTRLSYDYENDVFWVHLNEKIRDSLEVDKFVIDFSLDGRIAGVEIFDASKTISSMTLEKISKEALAATKTASLSVVEGKHFTYAVVGFPVKVNGKTVQVAVQAPTPKTAAEAHS